jgi:hypothetical protein
MREALVSEPKALRLEGSRRALRAANGSRSGVGRRRPHTSVRQPMA